MNDGLTLIMLHAELIARQEREREKERKHSGGTLGGTEQSRLKRSGQWGSTLAGDGGGCSASTTSEDWHRL